MNMPNMKPIIEANKLKVSEIRRINLLDVLNNKLYFGGYTCKFCRIIGHGFLIYKINKLELSRLLEIMEEYSDIEYQSIYRLLRNQYDRMIDDSFGLLIIDFCNNIFDIITDQNYPITTPEGLNGPYSNIYINLWNLKIFWFWSNIFREEITFTDADGEKTVTTNSDNLDKERLNRLLLSQSDNYILFMYDTLILNDNEEVDLKECTEFLEYLRRLYHLSVTLKEVEEGGISDDGYFTLFRPDEPTAKRLYGTLYDKLGRLKSEYTHDQKCLFLMSIDLDDIEELVENPEELEEYLDDEKLSIPISEKVEAYQQSLDTSSGVPATGCSAKPSD